MHKATETTTLTYGFPSNDKTLFIKSDIHMKYNSWKRYISYEYFPISFIKPIIILSFIGIYMSLSIKNMKYAIKK